MLPLVGWCWVISHSKLKDWEDSFVWFPHSWSVWMTFFCHVSVRLGSTWVMHGVITKHPKWLICLQALHVTVTYRMGACHPPSPPLPCLPSLLSWLFRLMSVCLKPCANDSGCHITGFGAEITKHGKMLNLVTLLVYVPGSAGLNAAQTEDPPRSLLKVVWATYGYFFFFFKQCVHTCSRIALSINFSPLQDVKWGHSSRGSVVPCRPMSDSCVFAPLPGKLSSKCLWTDLHF